MNTSTALNSRSSAARATEPTMPITAACSAPSMVASAASRITRRSAALAAALAACCIAAAPPVGDGKSPATPPAAVPPIAPAAGTTSYPDDPRLDAALGMMKRGSFDVAALAASTVLKARPDVDRAQAILGIALNKQKKYEEARVALEKASASTQPFPERRHVAHFLGWCCYHLGDYAAARGAFEAHLKAAPGEPDSTFGLALVALGEDRLDEADTLFAAALKGFSEPTPKPVDQARVLTRMSDLALRRDDVAAAEQLLDRAIKASPSQHETWAKVARVKDRLGKTAEADAARANEQRVLEALGRRAPDAAPAQPGAAPKVPDSAAPASPPTSPSASPPTSPSAPPPTSPSTSPPATTTPPPTAPSAP